MLLDSRGDSSLSSLNQQMKAGLQFLEGASFAAHEGVLQPTLEQLRSCDIIGLYFSASWCGPCTTFTPLLAQQYRELDGMNFEIIFVSCDKELHSFQEYFGKMPWIALNFDEAPRREHLMKEFRVKGIPTLVLYNTKTGAFTNRGVELAQKAKLRGILQPAATRTTSLSLKNPARGFEKTAESGAFVGSVVHHFKPKEPAGDTGPMESVPDRDLDYLHDHITKIEARLRDAKGMHKEKLEEELRRTREQIDKIKLLDEVKAQALIEEEKQRLALMQQVVEKIGAIGRCPMDFAWRWEGNGFRCEGGSHYATPEELGVSAEDCVKFFSKTGVMEI